MNKLSGKKITVAFLTLAFALVGSVFFIKDALAATGTLYISPSSASVQNGSNVTVSVRLTPGTATDTVTVNVGFDASKLRYVSTDYSGSPFNTQVGASTTSSSVSFTSTELSGTPVSTDSLVANLKFTALAGSGTSPIALTGNAAYAGAATNPTTSGATITFTTPATPTCPSGYTGTYPNCTAPSTGGTSGGSSGGSKTVTPSGTKPPTTTGATSTSNSKPTGTPAVVTGTQIEYTKGSVSFTTNVATKAYVRFGLDGQLTQTSAVSDYATSHNVVLDSAALVPGQQYSYVIVSTDQSGNVSQSAVATFSTHGLKITVGVFDSNHQPLRNKSVSLHSTPQTAKTDANGFATFNNVAPGDHHLVYTSGKKSYDKPITVANTVVTNGETQTATDQSFSVVYGFAQSSLHMSVWIWLAIIVLVIGAGVALAQTGRLGLAMQLRQNHAAPLISQPVIVGSNTSSPQTHETIAPNASTQERLNAIPDPHRPQPGMTVAPRGDDDQNGLGE